MITYKEGDLIRYATHSGGIRPVVVEMKEDDIKNGRPGFTGSMPDGTGVWGYDDQIISVDRRDG